MNDLSQKELTRAKKALLAAEQEDREISDYDIHIEIEKDTAQKRVAEDEKFVKKIEKYLSSDL